MRAPQGVFVKNISMLVALLALCVAPVISAAESQKTEPQKNSEAEYLFLKSNLEGFSGDVQSGKAGIEQLLVEHPESAYMHFLHAQYIMASTQDAAEAIAECEQSLALDPHPIEVKLFLARLYTDQAEPAKALVLFREVLQQKPEQTEIYMLLAQNYVQLKQYDKALATMQKLLLVSGPIPEAHMFIGSVYADYMHHPAQALAHYQKAVALDASFVAAYDAMVDLYVQQKQPEKALVVLQKIAAQEPHNPTTALRIALLYYDQKKYGEAIQQLNDILRDFPSADKVRYYLGTVYQEIQQFDGAAEAFLAIPADSLYFREARVRLIAQYKSLQHHEAAKKLLDDTITLQKDVSLYYELRAAFSAEEGDSETASKVLLQGIKVLPKDERLRALLAMLYEQQGKRKQALGQMQQVLKFNPDNPTALNYIAYSFAESGKRLADAETMVRHALELKINDPYMMDTLAWVLFKQQRLHEAKSLLESALQLGASEPTLHYHLAEVLLSEKNVAAAREHFTKALDLWKQQPQPDQKEIKKIQQRLQELGA